jgi:hypothetical protein
MERWQNTKNGTKSRKVRPIFNVGTAENILKVYMLC